MVEKIIQLFRYSYYIFLFIILNFITLREETFPTYKEKMKIFKIIIKNKLSAEERWKR